MANDKINIQSEVGDSQIVLYQPNESIKLEVKVDAGHDTVWLTQQQIADLFGTKRPAITKHLSNIFKSGELEQNSVCSILEHTASDGKVYKTQFYNLDAIISVGYRVNSVNATAFRQWANENLVRTANHRVIIIDGYVSSLTLSVLDVRKPEVSAISYTQGVGHGMHDLMDKHDELFPNAHIDIRKWKKESHDRWLIIDDSLYHCGHSLNANGGHKISAITLMGTSPEVILAEME